MPRKHPKKQPARDHAAFVVSSLSNPKEPQHCGACLYSALILAIPSSGDSHFTPYIIPTSLRKRVDFWNTLYKFVFQTRTDEEVESLLKRLARCSCPPSDRRFQSHVAGKIIDRNSTMAFASDDRKALYTHERISFVIEVFIALAAALSGSGVKSVAKGPLQTWPTTPLDLIPFGADSLVQTLLQWYRLIPDPVVFGLAGRITRVCQFVVIPSLAEFQFSRPAILRGKEEVEALEPHIRTAPQDTLQTRLLIQRFDWYFCNFYEYVRVLVDALPSYTQSRTLAGYETKAMQLFSLLVYVLNNSYPRLMAASFSSNCASYCYQRFRFFHMHLYPHPNYPVHPSVVEMDNDLFHPLAEKRSVPSAVAFYFMTFHQDTQCCAYGCPGSIQSAGNNFQRCSRCQIVSYCGRECQIRAWRDEKFPHKRICPIIRLLIDIAGGLGMFVSNPSSSQNLEIELPENLDDRRPIIAKIWEDAEVDRGFLQYVND